MPENERELIEIIRNHENAGQSFMTAATIIIGFLKQHESSEAPSSADLPVSS